MSKREDIKKYLLLVQVLLLLGRRVNLIIRVHRHVKLLEI
mgnify:CR=1 FL=1